MLEHRDMGLLFVYVFHWDVVRCDVILLDLGDVGGGEFYLRRNGA